MEKIENSLILGITNLDPEIFRKARRRKEPKLTEYRTGLKNRICFDAAEVVPWFEIHYPIKAEIIKEYLRNRT